MWIYVFPGVFFKQMNQLHSAFAFKTFINAFDKTKQTILQTADILFDLLVRD